MPPRSRNSPPASPAPAPLVPTTTINLTAAGSPAATAHLNAMLSALQDALRLPPVWNDGMRQTLDRAFTAYDAYIETVVTAHPMSCAAGCTACCHDNPRGITGIELKRLHEAVISAPGGGSVMAGFARLAANVMTRSEAATPDATATAWRRRREPCPCLQDGKCRAYSARPVACRAFHAVTPAAWCDPDDANFAARVNPHLDPPAVLLQAMRVLSARLGFTDAADLHRGMARLT